MNKINYIPIAKPIIQGDLTEKAKEKAEDLAKLKALIQQYAKKWDVDCQLTITSTNIETIEFFEHERY